MNQIMYKEEQEIKKAKKKSKLVRAIILIFIGIALLIASALIIVQLYDMKKPIFIPEETKLDIYIYENDIIVEAYNSQGLKSLFYKWKGKNSYSAYPDENDSSKLNVIIPILNGENTLYVEVLDSNGNITVKEQKIRGVTEAKIDIMVQDGYFVVNVVDIEKLKSIEYEFNNMNYSVDIGDVKEFSFMQKLDYGNNYIKITACNLQEIYSTKEMQYEHN